MATTPEAGEESRETVQVPLESLGNVSPGDTVQMQVVSVDIDNGVANLAPVESSEPAPDESATDKMAGEIENAPATQAPGM